MLLPMAVTLWPWPPLLLLGVARHCRRLHGHANLLDRGAQRVDLGFQPLEITIRGGGRRRLAAGTVGAGLEEVVAALELAQCVPLLADVAAHEGARLDVDG